MQNLGIHLWNTFQSFNFVVRFPQRQSTFCCSIICENCAFTIMSSVPLWLFSTKPSLYSFTCFSLKLLSLTNSSHSTPVNFCCYYCLAKIYSEVRMRPDHLENSKNAFFYVVWSFLFVRLPLWQSWSWKLCYDAVIFENYL